MANSDNVLRGGLTPKHVDVPELLATLSFEPHAPEPLVAVESAPGERRYETPADEFELALLEVLPGRPFEAAAIHGVEILLCLEGEVAIRSDAQAVSVPRGRAVLVPASLVGYVAAGRGRLARARVPPGP
jgi:mannose-6-phosphate isomerase